MTENRMLNVLIASSLLLFRRRKSTEMMRDVLLSSVDLLSECFCVGEEMTIVIGILVDQ